MSRNALISDNIRPVCIFCNIGLCKQKGKSKNGFKQWAKYCGACHKKIYNIKENGRHLGYRTFKKDICEVCGFIPNHSCQLDVDHIDGDKNNNKPDNLQTLCSNCHRLKTYHQKMNK